MAFPPIDPTASFAGEVLQVFDDLNGFHPGYRPAHAQGSFEAEHSHIIFDPIPRADGIESFEDPFLEPRASIYLVSGRRRRVQGGKS
jgi:hypothetical protein